MDLMSKAMGMLGNINPQAAQKAQNEFVKYSPDIDGLKQAVADWGGQVMIDKAIDFVNQSPRVKTALSMAGINPEQIRQQLNGTPSIKQNSHQSNASNPYRDRLSKFK